MNRNEWLAFLRSNDSEAKELLALHPGMKPPDESTWREAMKALWKDPGFRARNAAAVRENWKDPGFRARHAAAVRVGVLPARTGDGTPACACRICGMVHPPGACP